MKPRQARLTLSCSPAQPIRATSATQPQPMVASQAATAGSGSSAQRRSRSGSASWKAAKPDSTATRDITLQEVTGSNGKLRATLGLAIADPPGTYSYQLLLRTGAINGFDVPEWVNEFSSENPTASSDPNKTLNLAKFISDLRRASSSVQQPAVAKWYVNVRKL